MHSQSRRQFLTTTGYGLGGLAVAGACGQGLISAARASELVDPLAPKSTHFPAKAKSVIWLHMDGAPSTLDLFDYKPDLVKLQGQLVPESFLKDLKEGIRGIGTSKLLATNRTWKQYGQSGAWFSDLLPNIAQHADDIAFIKSSVTIGATHDISILKLNTGDLSPGRPSLGAWVQYALGAANPNLPAYVVLYNGKEPSGGSINWSSGFLPAVYQGTAFRPGDSPILHLKAPQTVGHDQQENSLALLNRLNRRLEGKYPEDTELRARNRSYELAAMMQSTAPEAVDLSKESAATRELYGLDNDATREYGTSMLRARRLVERGVRFIHVITGEQQYASDTRNWDAHNDLEGNHGAHTRAVDKPIAGLLSDLKARGLLESTLVVWTAEFGRTPFGQSGDGREHNPWGYTQWIAGGGSKAGTTVGATDEIGLKSIGDIKVDTYDLHATVLQLLGLDHLKTTFLHNGRSERPTVVYGKVIQDLIA